MDWASTEWKQSLPPAALQKVQNLEEQIEKMQKERHQKLIHIENMEQSLQNQKIKMEEEKSENLKLTRDLQKLDEQCREFEAKHAKLHSEIQAKDIRINCLEKQLEQLKNASAVVHQLESDITPYKEELALANARIVELEAALANQESISLDSELKFAALKYKHEALAEIDADENNEDVSKLKETILEQEKIISDLKLQLSETSQFEEKINRRESFIPASEVEDDYFWKKFESQSADDHRRSIRCKNDFPQTHLTTDPNEKITALEQHIQNMTREFDCLRSNSESVKIQMEQKFKENEKELKAEIKQQAQLIADLDLELSETKSKLQNEIIQANNELVVAKQQVDNLEKLKQGLEVEVEQLNVKITDLNNILETKEDVIIEISKVKSDIELEISRLTEENECLKKEVAELSSKLDNEEDWHEANEEFEVADSEEYLQLKTEMEEKTKLLNDAEQKVQDLQKLEHELSEAQDAITLKDELIKSFEKQADKITALTALENEHLALKETLEEMLLWKNDMELSSQHLQSQKDALEQELLVLKEHARDSQISEEQTKADLEITREELVTFTNKFEDQININNQLKASHKELESELNDARETINHPRTTVLDLETQLELKINEISTLTNENENLKMNLEQQLLDINELSNCVKAKEQEQQAYEEKIRLLEQQLLDIGDEIVSNKNVLTTTQNEIITVKEDLEDKITLCKELEKQNKDFCNVIDELNKELISKDDKELSSEKEFATIKSALEQKIEEKDEEIRELHIEISALNEEIFTLKSTVSSKEDLISSLNQDIIALNDSSKEQSELIEQLLNEKQLFEKNNSTMDAQLQLSNQELTSSKNKLVELQEALDVKIKLCQQLEEEIQNLQITVENLRAELDSKKSQIDSMSSNEKQYSIIKSALEKENEEMNQNIQKICLEMECLKETILIMESDIGVKSTSISTLESQVSTLNVLLKENLTVIEELKCEKRSLEEKLSDLNATLDSKIELCQQLEIKNKDIISSNEALNRELFSIREEKLLSEKEFAEGKAAFLQQIEEKDKEMQKLNLEISTLNEEMLVMKSNLIAKENLIESLNNDIALLKNSLTEQVKTIQDYQDQKECFEKENSVLKEQLQLTNEELTVNKDQLLDVQASFDEKNQTLQAVIEKLQMEVNSKQSEIETLSSGSEESIALKSTLEHEIEEKTTHIEELNLEIKSLKEKILILETDITTKNNSISTLENEISSSNSLLKDHLAVIEELKCEKQSLEEKLSDLNVTLDSKIELCQQLEIKNKDAICGIEAFNKELFSMQEKKLLSEKEFVEARAAFLRQIEEKDQEMRKLNLEISTLNEEMLVMKSNLIAKENLIESLNGDMTLLKNSLKEQVKTIQDYQDQKECFEKENSALKEQLQLTNKELTVNKDQLIDVQASFDEKIQTLQAVIEKLQMEVNSKQSEIEILSSGSEESIALKSTLEHEIEEKTTHIEELNLEIKSLKEKILILETDITAKNNSISTLEDEISSSNSLLKDHLALVEKLKTENEQLNDKVKVFQKDIDVMNTMIEEKILEKCSMEDNIHELENKVIALGKELDQLKDNSNSEMLASEATLKSYTEKFENAENTIKSYKEKLENAEENIKSYKEKLESSMMQQEEVQALVVKLKEELESYQEELSQKEILLKDVSCALKLHECLLEDKDIELKNNKNKIDELTKSNSCFLNTLSDSKFEFQDLDTHIIELTDKLLVLNSLVNTYRKEMTEKQLQADELSFQLDDLRKLIIDCLVSLEPKISLPSDVKFLMKTLSDKTIKMTEQLRDAELTISSKDEQCNKLSNIIYRYDLALLEKGTAIKNLEDILHSKEEKVAHLTQSLEEYKKLCHNREESIFKLNNELGVCVFEIKALESKLKSSKDNVLQLQSTKETLENNYSEVEKKINLQTDETKCLAQKVDEKEKKCMEMSLTIKTLEKDLEEMLSKNKELHEEVQTVNESLKTLQKLFEVNKETYYSPDQYKSLEITMQNSCKEVETLKEENTNLNDLIQTTETELLKIIEQYPDNETPFTSLQDVIPVVQELFSNLNEKKAELEDLQRDIELLKVEISNQTGVVAEKADKITELQLQLENCNNKIASITEEMSQLTLECQTSKDAVEVLQSKVSTLESTNKSLNSEIDNLQKDIDKYSINQHQVVADINRILLNYLESDDSPCDRLDDILLIVQKLYDDHLELKSNLDEKCQEILKLKKNIEEFTENIDKDSTLLSHKNEEIKDLQFKLADSKCEVKMNETTISELKTQLALLEVSAADLNLKHQRIINQNADLSQEKKYLLTELGILLKLPIQENENLSSDNILFELKNLLENNMEFIKSKESELDDLKEKYECSNNALCEMEEQLNSLESIKNLLELNLRKTEEELQSMTHDHQLFAETLKNNLTTDICLEDSLPVCVQKLCDKLNSQKIEIENCVVTIKEKDQVISELQGNVKKLIEKLDKTDVILSENSLKIENLQSELNSLANQSQEHLKTLSEKEIEITYWQEKHNVLEGHHQTILKETEQFKNLLVKILTENIMNEETPSLEDLPIHIQNICNELKQHKITIERQSEEIKKLENNILTLTANNNDEANALAENTAHMELLKNELAETEKQLKIYYDTISEKEQDINTWKTKYETNNQSLIELEQQISSLRSINAELKLNSTKSEENSTNLYLEKQQFQENIAKILSSYTAVEIELPFENISSSIQKLVEELLEMKTDADKRNTELLQFEKNVKELNEKITSNECLLGQKTQEYDKLKLKLDESDDQLQVCWKNLSDKENEISELKIKLDELKNSMTSIESTNVGLAKTIEEIEENLQNEFSEKNKLKLLLENIISELNALGYEAALKSPDEIPCFLQSLCGEFKQQKNEIETGISELNLKEEKIKSLEVLIENLKKNCDLVSSTASEKSQEIENLKNELEKYEKQLLNYCDDLKNKEEIVLEWKSKYEVQTKTIDELESTNRLLNSTIDEVEENLQKVYSDKQQFHVALNKVFMDEIADSELQSSCFDDILPIVQKFCHKFNFQKSELETEKLNVIKLNEELVLKTKDMLILKEKHQENEYLNAQLSDTRSQLEKTLNDIKCKDSVIIESNTKLETLTKSSEEFQKQLISLKEENQRLNLTIDEVEENLQQVFQQNKKIQQDLNKILADHDLSCESYDEIPVVIEKLCDELNTKKSLIKEISHNLDEKDSEIITLEKTIKDLNEEINKHMNLITQKSQENDLLNQKLNASEMQLENCCNDLKSKEQQLLILSDRLESSETKHFSVIEELKAEVATLMHEKQECQNKLTKIMSDFKTTSASVQHIDETLKLDLKKSNDLISSLQKKIVVSAENVPKLVKQVDILVPYVEKLQSEIKSKCDFILNQEQLLKEKDIMAEKQIEIFNELQNSYKQISDDCRQLKERNRKLENDLLQEQKKQISGDNIENSKLKNLNSILQKEINDWRNKFDNLVAINSGLSEKIEKSQLDSTSVDTENHELLEIISNLKQQIMSLEKEKVSLEGQLFILNSNAEKTNGTENKFLARIKELEESIASYSQKLQDQNHALLKKSQEIENLTSTVENLKNENELLVSQKDTLYEKSKNADTELWQSKTEFQALRKSFEELKIKNSTYASENTSLKSIIATLKSESISVASETGIKEAKSIQQETLHCIVKNFFQTEGLLDTASILLKDVNLSITKIIDLVIDNKQENADNIVDKVLSGEISVNGIEKHKQQQLGGELDCLHSIIKKVSEVFVTQRNIKTKIPDNIEELQKSMENIFKTIMSMFIAFQDCLALLFSCLCTYKSASENNFKELQLEVQNLQSNKSTSNFEKVSQLENKLREITVENQKLEGKMTLFKNNAYKLEKFNLSLQKQLSEMQEKNKNQTTASTESNSSHQELEEKLKNLTAELEEVKAKLEKTEDDLLESYSNQSEMQDTQKKLRDECNFLKAHLKNLQNKMREKMESGASFKTELDLALKDKENTFPNM